MGSLISRHRDRNRGGTVPFQARSIPIHTGNLGPAPYLQACHGFSAPPATNTKKALLIGIRYQAAHFLQSTLLDLGEGPHMEIGRWRDMLINNYNYPQGHITSMADISEYEGTPLWPNKDNILRQLENLVSGVGPGDRRFLFIAAHGDQCDCTSDRTEVDGKDEVMLSLEENQEPCKIIKDNDFRRILVDKFPAGAYLTIVLELCHSGTLIDLPFRLNYHGKNKPPTVGRAKKNPTDLQGNILCLSACEDWQKAYTVTDKSSRCDQGILTAIIYYNLACSRDNKGLPVNALLETLIENCADHDSSRHKPTQTPVVTLGKKLSKKELESLVFQP